MHPPVRVTPSRAPEPVRRERRRAPSLGAQQSRAARAATSEIASKLSLWQARIARLRGAAQHRSVADSQLQQEVEALAGLIRDAQLSFYATVATLPEEIAGHGRIVDVQRALHGATQALVNIESMHGA